MEELLQTLKAESPASWGEGEAWGIELVIMSDKSICRRFYYQAKVSRKGINALLPSLCFHTVRHAIVCHIIRGTVDCDSQW